VTRVARLLAVVVAAMLAAAGLAVPAAAGDSRAVVVIDTGQSVRWVDISFSGEISGIEALELAGANPVTSAYAGQGIAVCGLDGVGHDSSDCLGTPSDPQYWAYYRASSESTGWSYSRGGASGVIVRDGDVEGWRYGTGAAPRVAVCSVTDCAPPAPEPVPEPPPVAAAAEAAPGSAAAPTDPAAASGDAAGDTAATTLPAADAGGSPGAGNGKSRQERTRALGAPPRIDDPGSGSPVGVLVAAVIVAALAGAAVVFRRRGRAAG
jgi:hypothetical protein